MNALHISIYGQVQAVGFRDWIKKKADIRKLLDGILPHLKMKNLQAKAVLAFIDEPDSLRKLELKREAN